jgi:DNA helicase-2/ATP-dependent DNA helicase PcrA
VSAVDTRPAPGAFPPEIVSAMGGRAPTEQQWAAISMPLEPGVVVAGAGSGKTSVMAARIVYLALAALGRVPAGHDGVLPGNVLCLTFTNKATENLALRVRRALATVELPEGEEPTILNYHAFAAEILERHGLLAGIEPGQRILSLPARAELCARVLDEMTFEHVPAEWQPTLVSKILELSEQAANHRVEPEEIIRFNLERLEQLRVISSSDRVTKAALERIELARAAVRFRELKRELGAIDFGDQITLALEIVERFPAVSREYRDRYRAALLDEYQDTNVAQAALIAEVFGEGFPVTAVGDPDQNIYAWRGASLFNLLEFPRTFLRDDGTDARKLPLYTNFRSGSRILAAADCVIAPLPAEQRPDPGKQLVPWPANGEGEVQIVRLPDEWAEATWIAERIRAIRDAATEADPEPWSSFAVLCRKSRLFEPLRRAFGEVGIPAEFVGLAGLVKLPEVAELLAYARAVADPMAGVALARILLGPRYRVGFKDLARVAAWAKGANQALRAEDEHDIAPFLFAEALEHLDEVEGLSGEGRGRLEEFAAELAELRTEARRPVPDFLATVLRRSGLLAELDADPDAERAAGIRRNLSAFLDEVHAFSPLEGEPTLRAFLDYVQLVEASDRQEWSPVQPSSAESVKVMTIHQAKGLEFDTVFVPGLARGILPDLTIQHNPAERGKSIDFELRGDAAILPAFDGNLSKYKEALREQELIEERRTCYVALTRARRRLFASAAHWYGDDVQKPKPPGQFLEELGKWGDETGLATVDLGAEPPEENPLVGYRERFVRDWPGPARPPSSDDLFPDGWRRAALAVSEDRSALASAVGALEPSDREAFERASGEGRLMALDLLAREAEPARRPGAPTSVAVGGLIDYARCPKRFYWTAVRPLPRFSGPAARIGTRIHAWIERQAAGQTALFEVDDQPDFAPEELAGEPGKIERLQQAFLASRFAGSRPLFAERPFLLSRGGFTLSGRIDAIYGSPDGPWEVVDYKTGRKPAEDDALAGLQLDIYALACTEVWGKRPEDLTLTYLYLASADEVSRPAGPVDEIRERVGEWLRGIGEGQFAPTPGDQCRWCDFLPFCDAGRAFQASRGGAPAG